MLAFLLAVSMFQPNTNELSSIYGNAAQGLSAAEDPIGDRLESLREAAKRKDIKAWLKISMPQAFHLGFCPELHDYLISIRHEGDTATEAPRGSAKTAIGCIGIPLFGALEEPEICDYFLNLQGTEKKALAVNLGIKLELEQNELLRLAYGEQVGADKWTDALFVLRNGVVFQAASTGQSLRGTNYRMRRPQWIQADDVFDDEDINNPESTQKKNDWLESTLWPMMASSGKTFKHLQGTAINDIDALKKMEERAKSPGSGIKFRRFTAIDETAKTSLWPEQRSYEDWLKKRDGMSAVIFAREYMNDRRDDSSAIVKPSWLKDWEFDPATLRFDRDHRLLGAFLLVDPSIGQKVENDATAMVVLLKSQRADAKGADYWIMKLVNERLTLNDRILRMQDIIDSPPFGHRLTKGRIEAVAGFKDFAAEARRRLKGLGVEDVDVVKDKISVLESKSWHFQNGKVHLSKGIPAPLRTELYNQMTVNHPQHDDLRDALLLGLDGGATNWGQFL